MGEMFEKQENKIKLNKFGLAAAVASFLICIIYFNLKNVTVYFFDSNYYWTIGDEVFNGKFNLLNYPETFRGCLWPLILQFSKKFGMLFFEKDYMGFRVVMSLLLAILISVVFPTLFEKKVNSLFDIFRLIISLLLILFFWGDYLCYPLSDFFSFFSLAIAIMFFKFSLYKKDNLIIIDVLNGLICGIMMYASYNTRVVYKFAIIVAILIYICVCIMHRNVRAFFILSVFVGIILISIPQSMINKKYIDSYIPRVVTEQYSNYKKGLETLQVYGGLVNDNYETYYGPNDQYPEPGVFFSDKIGVELLKDNGIKENNFKYTDLIKLFLKHPLDITSIYVRHLVSLLTPKYKETYISNVYYDRGIITTFIVFMWYVIVSWILIKIQNKDVNLDYCITMFIIFVPSLFQFFGMPEIRFFLPIHFMCYFYFVNIIDYKEYYKIIKSKKLIVICSFIIIYAFWVAILSGILSNNVEKVFFINDNRNVIDNVIK